MGIQATNAVDWTLTLAVRSIRVGVTGGIGSGKSTVAAILSQLKAIVIDADAISRRLTAGKGEALPQIKAIFGSKLLNENGGLNREKMREIVFNDSAAKDQLQRILHPLIQKEMLAQANFESNKGAACIVFDIPLLVESGVWRSLVDLVLVVDCTTNTQLNRIRARDGLSDTIVQTVMAAQVGRNERLNAADIVVFNDNCSLDQLGLNVQACAQKIGQLFSDWNLQRDPLRIPL